MEEENRIYPKGKHPNSLKNLTPGFYGPGVRGRPTTPEGIAASSKNLPLTLKHSYFFSSFALCSNCPYFARQDHGKADFTDAADCPEFRKFQTEEGLWFCSFEINYFNEMKETMADDFELKKSDLMILDNMIFKMILINRARKYMAAKGSVQHAPVFNPKTGKEHWLDTPNILDKHLYYAERDVREWLENLKLSRKDREPREHKIDVAVEFTERKEINITATKEVVLSDGKKEILKHTLPKNLLKLKKSDSSD